jgi:thiamine kinase-like enzyme
LGLASQFLPETALVRLEKLFGSAARRAPAERITAATNLVIHLRLPDASYAVRVPGAAASDFEIDRRSECAALAAVASAAIGPSVIACDPDSGLLITRWIEGETWTAQHAREPDAIQRIGGALRKLHSLSTTAAIRSLAPRPLLEQYWRIVASRAAAWHSRLAPLHERIVGLTQQPPAEPEVLCHSDLHHRNLIENDAGLRLLDCEYAGLTERAYDLASFAQSNDLTRAQQERLLDAYGATQPLCERFEWQCVLFDWICVLWLAAVNGAEGSAERRRLEMLVERVRNSPEAN